MDARGSQPRGDALLGGGIGQVEHKLIKSGRQGPVLAQPDDLQVNRATGQAKDRPVQAVAVAEGFEHRQPDRVPVEADRLVVIRAPPHHPQRTYGKMLRPARAWLCCVHADSVHQPGQAQAAGRPAAVTVNGGAGHGWAGRAPRSAAATRRLTTSG